VLSPADLPGPYVVEDKGPGGSFEGVPAELAAIYREIGGFPWFYHATYRPLTLGQQPSSVQTAEQVLPSAAAAQRVLRQAGALARGFYGSGSATAAGHVAVGSGGRAFSIAALTGAGRPARARVIVWRSANVIGLVGVVGGAKELAAELAQRQQRRILRATGGRRIAVPGPGAGIDRSGPVRGIPSYRRLTPATPNGEPVTIARTGTWTLERLGAGGAIIIVPGNQGVSLPFSVAPGAAGHAVLRLHVRIDLAADAGPGRELNLVGAIDGRVSVSSRLNAAIDPHTGKLHLAGDDVSDTTSRRIEFTSKQIVPGGSLSAGPHLLELRLAPALDQPLRAIRAVILPDSAIIA
jgi:hypothetical protein